MLKMASTPKYNCVEDFVSQQLELLNIEKEAEIAQNRALQENLAPKVLQEKGICLLSLRVVNIRSGLYGRTIVTFGPKIIGKELPSTNLSSGDIVGIFLNSAPSLLEKDEICSGLVSNTTTTSIDVALDTDVENTDLGEEEIYKICKLSNNVTFKRLKGGLEGLKNYSGPANRLVGSLLSGQQFSPPHATLPPVLANAENQLVWFNQSLDYSQKQAVEFTLKQRELAVIHGPPGTGKTTTIVEVILQAVKAGNRILVCAPSNVAVDNVLEKLSPYSFVKTVRLGHPTRMQSSIQRFSLDAVLANSDSRAIVNDVRRELDAQLKQISQARKNKRSMFSEVKTLRKELKTRETKALKEVLTHANVVLATLTSSTQDGPLKHLPLEHFDMVVVDECSQATEAACWLALTRAPKVLLAGDHFQLPPTVISPEAERKGLGLTLMERILKRDDGETCVKMLTVQYRMHHSIMDWASQQLYNGKLEAHSCVAKHLLSDLPNVEENSDTGIPLLFIDTAGCDFYESAASDEGSKANSGEAALVVIHARRLIASGVPAADIAIVTPYNLQVELLRQILHPDYPALEIRSVDGFQGREKEAVILSLVRSNKTGSVGFVADVRRLNVACTRARRHLCLIADSSTTSQASSGLVEYMEQTGEVRSAHEYLQEIDKVAVPEVGTPVDVSRDKAAKTSSTSKPPPAELSKEEKERLAARLIDQLEKWSLSSDASTGKPKEFPTSLTPYERAVVHEWAEKHGFHHRSVGEKRNRRILVQKVLPVLTENTGSKPTPETCIEDTAAEVSRTSHADTNSFVEPSDVSPDSQTTEQLFEDYTETISASPTSRNDEVAQQSQSKFKKAKEVPQTKIKAKEDSAPPGSGLTKCAQCGKELPSMNMELHALRCSKTATQAVRPKQKPNVKPLPNPIREAKQQPEEDFDEILNEFKKIDNVCNYSTCKTSITVLGQQCNHCRRRFCLSHHLPEIHGCGEAARQVARSAAVAQSYSSASCAKSKPIDATKRAHLQRRLDKKLEDLSVKRTGTKEGKKKSK